MTETDSRVIDPEFAFYGPNIGFDLGAFFGNLLLSLGTHNQGTLPGLTTALPIKNGFFEQAVDILGNVPYPVLALCAENAKGDVIPVTCFPYPRTWQRWQLARSAFVDFLFADMLGFGAAR